MLQEQISSYYLPKLFLISDATLNNTLVNKYILLS